MLPVNPYDFGGDAVSGQGVSGTLAIDGDAGEAVLEAQADRGGELSASEKLEVAAEAAVAAGQALEFALDAPLVPPQEEPSTEALPANRNHRADIVYLDSGEGAPGSLAALSSFVGDGFRYWSGQSQGVVTGSVGQVQLRGGYTEAQVCSFSAAIAAGARAFGRSINYYLAGARHLVVVVNSDLPDCNDGATGRASMGGSLHQGGVVWVNLGWMSAPSLSGANLTLAHEFGHNLGLEHGYSRVCNPPAVDAADGNWMLATGANPCGDHEYYDVMNVMGFSQDGTDRTPALPMAQRDRLGVATSELRAVNPNAGRVQNFTINPLTSTSGTRGLKIASEDGDYYVEFRNGTGQDVGFPFATASSTLRTNLRGQALCLNGIGVRVHKAYPPATGKPGIPTTVISHRETCAGSSGAHQSMGTGDSITTHGSNVRITAVSVSATQATVKVEYIGRLWHRLSGADRFATAAAVSRNTYSKTGGTVILATGLNYPDSLSATPLAAKFEAPLLLTLPNALPKATRDEINRLKPSRIVVVGGTGAVSNAVFNSLKASGRKVERVSGDDRYATSIAIARLGWGSGAQSAFVATGTGFADALSAGAAAGKVDAPVVLVPGDRSIAPTPVTRLLDSLKVKRVYISGGPGAVSRALERSSLAKSGRAVTRYAGVDRFDTLARIAADFNTPNGRAYVANGMNFPDALAGAAAAGAKDAPVMLVQTGCMPGSARAVISNVRVMDVYTSWRYRRARRLGKEE